MAGSLLSALGLKPSRRALDAASGQSVAGKSAGEPASADSEGDAPTSKLGGDTRSSTPAPSQSLPTGAKVKPFGTSRIEYDFGQPITRAQAADAVFADGKVPRGFKLEAGPGANGWTLRADDPADLDAWQKMVNRMRARTQEVDTRDPGQVKEDWSGASKGKAKTPGFWVNRRYHLDVSEIPEWMIRRRLHESGAMGYEVVFDAALGEDEVKAQLFAGNAPWDQIQLLPMGGAPTTVWVIRLIGIEAYAFNRTASSVLGWDPKSPVKTSAMPGVPDAMRKHLEGKTVPKGATKHRSNVYVWEEGGHLAYVETDAPEGGGTVYKFETTRIAGIGGKGDQEYLRDLVLNQGMKPKDAWTKYEREFLELVKGMGGAVDLNVPKLQMPRGAGLAPRGTRRVSGGGSHPPANIEHVPGSVGHPPGGGVHVPGESAHVPSGGGQVAGAGHVPGDVGHAPVGGGHVPAPGGHGGGSNPPSKPSGRGNTVADSVGPLPAKPPAPAPLGNLTPGQFPDKFKLHHYPANQQIKIKTPAGVRELTVGEYRELVDKAKRWRASEWEKLNLPRGDHGSSELTKKAQEKFGLDNDWFSAGNKYIYGREPRL